MQMSKSFPTTISVPFCTCNLDDELEDDDDDDAALLSHSRVPCRAKDEDAQIGHDRRGISNGHGYRAPNSCSSRKHHGVDLSTDPARPSYFSSKQESRLCRSAVDAYMYLLLLRNSLSSAGRSKVRFKKVLLMQKSQSDREMCDQYDQSHAAVAPNVLDLLRKFAERSPMGEASTEVICEIVYQSSKGSVTSLHFDQ
jgi:hypothetical protein